MDYQLINISDLQVSNTNDRHGEVASEKDAIEWLLEWSPSKMFNLAKDIAEAGQIYDPPLVRPEDSYFRVYDGNRRTACLKVMSNPNKYLNKKDQKKWAAISALWEVNGADSLNCQVETDLSVIDDIIYRRHSGVQGGVGQAIWDDPAKQTFLHRTGKIKKHKISEAIDNHLRGKNLIPSDLKVPRSKLDRLFSSEAFRTPLGFSYKKDTLSFNQDEAFVSSLLATVVTQLANKKPTLADLWDEPKKKAYIKKLSDEGLLPPRPTHNPKPKPKQKPTPAPLTLIDTEAASKVDWPADLRRTRMIWEELQFHLKLNKHPNAISVLIRVLIELSVDDYINKNKINNSLLKTINTNTNLSKKIEIVAKDLQDKEAIEKKYFSIVQRVATGNDLFSTKTMNDFVHSNTMWPNQSEMVAIWKRVEEFVIQTINNT